MTSQAAQLRPKPHQHSSRSSLPSSPPLGSQSSFGDDPAFLDALATAELTPPRACIHEQDYDSRESYHPLGVAESYGEVESAGRGLQERRPMPSRFDLEQELELERELEDEHGSTDHQPKIGAAQMNTTSTDGEQDMNMNMAATDGRVKRKRPEDPGHERVQDPVSSSSEIIASVESSRPTSILDLKAQGKSREPEEYLDSEAYDPISFGDFRSFMRHKRAKLRVQQAALLEEEELASRLTGKEPSESAMRAPVLVFAGCTIYVNGLTSPPYTELRRLVVLHGGNFMAYLDQKSPVTHIVASNLTPKKRIEFARYRVVKPGWIVESARQGKLLNWREWRCDAETGSNAPGSDTRRTAPGAWRLAEKEPTVPGSQAWASGLPKDWRGTGTQNPGVSATNGGPAMTRSGSRDSRGIGVGESSPWGRLGAQRKLSDFVPNASFASRSGSSSSTAASPSFSSRDKAEFLDSAVLGSERTVATINDPSTAKGAEAQGHASSGSSEGQGNTEKLVTPEKPSGKQAQTPTSTPTVGGDGSPSLTGKPDSAKDHVGLPAWLDDILSQPRINLPQVAATDVQGVSTSDHPKNGPQEASSSTQLTTPDHSKASTEADSSKIAEPSERSNDLSPVVEMPSKRISTATAATGIEEDSKVFPGLGTDPPSRAAAIAAGHARPEHPYANRPSNEHAAKLLASPSWRKQHTATSAGFLSGYFGKSRLHHLSTWKADLQDMVGQALRDAGRTTGSKDLPRGTPRVIMHIDFDSFFVSVGLRNRPDLRDKPVVVCHGSGSGGPSDGAKGKGGSSAQASTSEIASCNYIARSFGIRNGGSLGQARKLCPEVQTIPYDFAAYNEISIQFYTILLAQADALQAVSVDEALIDVSLSLEAMRRGQGRLGIQAPNGEGWTAEKQFAERLRAEILQATGCEASIGIGRNILLARLATRKAKPGGSFHLVDDEVPAFLAALDVDDLHGIGWSMRKQLRELYGTVSVGELMEKASKATLLEKIGPTAGETLYNKLRGIDKDRIEPPKSRQSVGANVNYGIRFINEEEVVEFISKLSDDVARRLKQNAVRGRHLTIRIMVRAADAPKEAPKFMGHGVCDVYHRSSGLTGPGGSAVGEGASISRAAWALVKALKVDPKELRGVGMAITKLEPVGNDRSDGVMKGRQALLNFKARSQAAKQNDPGQAATIGVDSTAKESGDTIADGAETVEGSRDFGGPLTQGEALEDHDRALNDKTLSRPPALFLEPNDDEGEGSSDEKLLQPGPASLPLRRSPSPEPVRLPLPPAARDVNARAHPPPVAAMSASGMVPLTQMEIPPISQLDQEAVMALPAAMQAQIADARQRASHAVSPGRGNARASDSGFPETSPTSTQSSPMTPRKAAQFMAPSFSQLSKDVLDELPASVRKEVLRQYGIDGHGAAGESSRASAPADDKVTTPTKQKSNNANVAKRRAASASPRKSAWFKSPSKQKVLNFPSRAQPAVDRAAVLGMDPSKVPEHELRALEISPEWFHDLPREIQREVLHDTAAAKRSKEMRLVKGRRTEEVTRAEVRRREAEAASRRKGIPGDDPGSFAPVVEARPMSVYKEGASSLPRIKGLSGIEEVRELLSAWFEHSRNTSPRAADAVRITEFLIACVQPDPLGGGRIGAPTLDLEKVAALLQWWRFLLRTAWPSGEETEKASNAAGLGLGHAHGHGQGHRHPSETLPPCARAWWNAFRSAREEVDVRVKARFGAPLALE